MSELITQGAHRAVLRSVSWGWTAKNKEEAACGFEITDGDGPDTGRFITDFSYPDAGSMNLDIFVENMRRCGWPGDDLAELPALARDGKLATEVELIVEHEQYDGKWRAKVKFVNRVGGGPIVQKNPMNDRDLASFAARMKAKVRASTGVKRAGSPPAPAPTQQNIGHPNAPGNVRDDDVPF